MAQNPLDPALVDALLDRLSSDDVFRELFATDPHKALAELGYRHPAECMKVTKLASKDEIRKARDELREQLLTVERLFRIHKLEA